MRLLPASIAWLRGAPPDLFLSFLSVFPPASDYKLHQTLSLSTHNIPLSLCLCHSSCLECLLSLSDKYSPTHPSIPSSNAPFSRKLFPPRKAAALWAQQVLFANLARAQHTPGCHFPVVSISFGINERAERSGLSIFGFSPWRTEPCQLQFQNLGPEPQFLAVSLKLAPSFSPTFLSQEPRARTASVPPPVSQK